MAFSGLRVLSLESRRADQMRGLIEREGGVPFVAPSVKERAVDGPAVALRFIEQLEAGDFDLVIAMTGVGLAFLRDAAPSAERFGAALRRAAILSRGPKPLGVLRALDVPVAVVVPEPNTWKEIVDAVAARTERRIALQEYGRSNPELNAALEELGATVTSVAGYRWELPEELEPLREAARRLAAGKIDVVLFTSRIQLDHLLEIARSLNLESEVLAALQGPVKVASIGPVMTEALKARGIQPAIIPRHPKMWALVKAAAEW